MTVPILEVQHVSVSFAVEPAYTIQALEDVSFTVGENEIIGIVGESGCGKSTLARTLMGLYQPQQGHILFHGREISSCLRHIQRTAAEKRSIQMIFQDADGALNPYMTAESLLKEALFLGKRCHDKREVDSIISQLLKQTGLDARCRQELPGELSGGQRQRVAIARCLGMQPEVIIADEPIAALDVSIQAQILNLLQRLQRQQHFAMLFIAHDLAVIRHICDRVMVLYGGHLVETGPTEELFCHPRHPYTRKLLQSILYPDPAYERGKRKHPLTLNG